jgi:WD40-like Beta Propeller Repeat
MSPIKRIVLSVLFLIVVFCIGYAIYFFFFSPSAPAPAPANANANKSTSGLPAAGQAGNRPVVPTNGNANAGLPSASLVANGGPTVVSTLVSGQTIGATLGSDGQSVNYYDPVTGKFFTVKPDGTKQELSPQVFPDVQNVTWSADGKIAVIEFPDGSKITFNFDTQKQTSIPNTWSDFSFSQKGDLATKNTGDNSDENWLVVSNNDGSDPQAFEPMGDNSDKVIVDQSPNGQVAAFSETGPATDVGSRIILLIGKNGENMPGLTVKGENFDPLWSPDGSLLLYSTASTDDDYKPRLYIVDGTGPAPGDNKITTDLFTTADKCVFAGEKKVYCAVPDALPEGSGLEPETLNGTPDSIYSIDTATGAITFVGRPENDMTVSKLQVSSDGADLFLLDEATGFIKKMLLR